MYLEHFKLTKFPFALTPNTAFYCDLPSYEAAFSVLMVSLKNGEGFLKITGEVGCGKTLLCRKLLNELAPEKHFVTAYIPNPDLTPAGLRKAVATELGIELPVSLNQHDIIERLNAKLLTLHADGKQVVVIIDEAQALSTPCLEAVRLLTNLETESEKLLQVVLFGQPELDQRLQDNSLRQLNQRITFSYQLRPLSRDELNGYLAHRLAMAGYTYGPTLFTVKACDLLFKASRGLPRIINILAHKSLLFSYGRGEKTVNYQAMKAAIQDSHEVVSKQTISSMRYWWFSGVGLLSTAVMAKFSLLWFLAHR